MTNDLGVWMERLARAGAVPATALAVVTDHGGN